MDNPAAENCFRLGKLFAKVGGPERHIVPEEKVLQFTDAKTGAEFFFGLDSVGNGITFGGVRLLQHGKTLEGMRDAMRLSEAMTHKLAMIDEAFGGSKMVVLAPEEGKRDALLHAIGEYVEAMKGSFITAIDFGFEPEDAVKIREKTSFILGFDGPGSIGASGVTTAMGAFEGMGTLLEEAFGSAKIKGRSFAIQGLGSVGRKLAELLLEAGGSVFISDSDPEKLKPFRALGRVQVIEPDELLSVSADVLCPSGPGCVLNSETIPQLRAKAVAGVANCVLDDEMRDDRMLRDVGIVFAPDFVLNAGGVMQGIEEYMGGGLMDTMDKLPVIPKNLRSVFKKAKDERKGTMEAAKDIARQRRRMLSRPG
jgi:glutamate dehydrogenase/leucine dehydrogenase